MCCVCKRYSYGCVIIFDVTRDIYSYCYSLRDQNQNVKWLLFWTHPHYRKRHTNMDLATIWNVFSYYLGCFQFWLPCHKSCLPSFREPPIYNKILVLNTCKCYITSAEVVFKQSWMGKSSCSRICHSQGNARIRLLCSCIHFHPFV